MMEKIRSHRIGTLLLITGAVYFFLEYLTPLVAPILVAMLFVTIFGSTFKKMQKKFHINRQVSAVLLLLIACVLVGLLVWILFSWIVGSLPEWVGRLEEWEQEIVGVVHRVCEAVGNTIGIDSTYLEETIISRIEEGIDYVQVGAVPGVLSQSWEYVKVIGSLGGFLITFLIASVLLAKDYDEIMNGLLDREDCHVLLEVICGIIRYIATFVKAQLIIMSSIGAVSAIVLGISGVKHGAMWGILAGVLDVFPFIGTGIVLIPLALTLLFQGMYTKAVFCILLYVGCAFLREFLEPRLIGKKVGVPAIAVLGAVYGGIQLFGVWGIIQGPLGFMIIYQTYQSLWKRAGAADV